MRRDDKIKDPREIPVKKDPYDPIPDKDIPLKDPDGGDDNPRNPNIL